LALGEKGEFFDSVISVNNVSVPVYQAITVSSTHGVNNGSQLGSVYVPPATESFGYDLDGNLTTDGRWQYTWDGENRLVQMIANPNIAVPAGAKLKLVFEYDAKGRRIWKQIYTWNTGTSSYNSTAAVDLKFLYDGWNLLAELNSANSLQRAYLWGSDLSRSMQGAGGVGGLIAMKSTAGGAHFAAYDGNGNVMALVDASLGTYSAQYEYGPFGELLRATGSQAKTNPFRFSTKFTDGESDLFYYGYRYYNTSTGSWLNRDPIEEKGGNNLHRFVHNDCVNRFDRHGLVDENSTVEEIEAEVRRLIQEARDMGWTVGPDMLQNYLNGGGDQLLSASWLRSFSKVRVAEQKNQGRFQASLERIVKGMKCGETKTFHDYWDAQISYEGRGFSFDELFFASRDSTLTSTGDFYLTKNCCMSSYSRRSSSINCEETVITGTVDHHWHDRYNWNIGADVYIPGHGNIPDAALDKLRTQGSAKDFNMSSDWQQTLSGFVYTCPFAHETWRWQGP
jgi:RHS repeat-associated protein